MLVTFSTDAYANITVFGDVAAQLLKMMGHSGAIPGAILGSEVGGALSKLKQGVADSPSGTTTNSENRDSDEQESDVSLKNRALPLIELLSAADAKKSDVMWK